MKRLAIVVVVLALALAAFIFSQPPSSQPPRFLPWSGAARLPTQVSGFEQPQLHFDTDRVWLYSQHSRSNAVLYDTAKRRPLGQLTNAIPVALLGDRLLCSQDFTRWRWLEHLARAFRRPTQTRYWLLDLGRNTTEYLGRIRENRSFNLSHYVPSPDTQRGLLPVNLFRLGRTYWLDLPARRIRSWPIQRIPSGWWDNTHLLFVATNGNICLFDVVAAKSSVLIDRGHVRQYLESHRLAATDDPPLVTTRWTGERTDFYLSSGGSFEPTSYLVEITRPDGRLALRDPHFRSEPGGQMDPSGRYYLYDETLTAGGEDFGALCGGLTARDLRTGTNRVLVPPDTTGRFFARPAGRFPIRQDHVYYLRDHVLWKVALDGSRREQVFPPPGPQASP